MGILRREREVRIEFQQLVNEPRDLTAASVARFDPERAQERQFERPVRMEFSERTGLLRGNRL
jgi:hypothetical protein